MNKARVLDVTGEIIAAALIGVLETWGWIREPRLTRWANTTHLPRNQEDQ